MKSTTRNHTEEEVKKFVRRKYGEIAHTQRSCCGSSTRDDLDTALNAGYSEEDLRDVPEDSNMGLGCGNPIALASLKEGETVLDLGSGGGLDVFLAAKRVGPRGKVIGVDMTEEMVFRSKAAASKYGWNNVEFRLGEIENLPIEDNSIDVVVSNCVINLSPDKKKVFREAYRVLKTGGRMMISDLVTEGELSGSVRKNLEAWAGCVAGAMEENHYLTVIRKAGFKDVRIVSEKTFNDCCSQTQVKSVQVEAYKRTKNTRNIGKHSKGT